MVYTVLSGIQLCNSSYNLLLQSLHWLPIYHQVNYKIATLTSRCFYITSLPTCSICYTAVQPLISCGPRVLACYWSRLQVQWLVIVPSLLHQSRFVTLHSATSLKQLTTSQYHLSEHTISPEPLDSLILLWIMVPSANSVLLLLSLLLLLLFLLHCRLYRVCSDQRTVVWCVVDNGDWRWYRAVHAEHIVCRAVSLIECQHLGCYDVVTAAACWQWLCDEKTTSCRCSCQTGCYQAGKSCL